MLNVYNSLEQTESDSMQQINKHHSSTFIQSHLLFVNFFYNNNLFYIFPFACGFICMNLFHQKLMDYVAVGNRALLVNERKTFIQKDRKIAAMI